MKSIRICDELFCFRLPATLLANIRLEAKSVSEVLRESLVEHLSPTVDPTRAEEK